jgi:hypothetical protein
VFYWAAKGTCKLRSPAAKGPWAACPDSDGGPGRDSDTPHLGPGDGSEVQVAASAPSMRRCHSAHAPSRRAGALGSRARGRHSGWAPPCRGGHHTSTSRRPAWQLEAQGAHMRRLSVSASGWVRTRPRRGSDGPHRHGPARAGPGGGAAACLPALRPGQSPAGLD